MGQSGSSDNSLPETVETLQDEICRQARVISVMAGLSYNDFQQHLGELNKLSKSCMDADGKVMVFAVKKGSDSTMLWRNTVRIACIKADLTTKKIDSYRLLNLSQFLRVFKSIQSQFEAAQQASVNASLARSSSGEGSSSASSCSSVSSGSRNPGTSQPLTSSEAITLLEQRVEEAANGLLDVDKLIECCICLERKPEVMLPCAHSYCLPCLEQWNVNHKTCPICREALDSTDDTWVISDIPAESEISEDICNSLMKLASSPPEDDR